MNGQKCGNTALLTGCFSQSSCWSLYIRSAGSCAVLASRRFGRCLCLSHSPICFRCGSLHLASGHRPGTVCHRKGGGKLMLSPDHPSEDDASRGSFLTSPAGLVMVGFLTIGGVFLWMGHRAHLRGALLWM